MRSHFSITALVTALVAMIIGSIGVFGLVLNRSINDATGFWNYETSQMQLINRSIADLKGAIGYGGAIHNLKNYAIRRDEAYLLTAREDIREARQNLFRLGEVLTGEEARSALKAVSDTIDLYEEKFIAAASVLPDAAVDEFDLYVKVDDVPALRALDDIVIAAGERLEGYNAEGTAKLRQAKQVLWFGVFVMAIVAAAGFAVVFFVRRSEHLREVLSETVTQVDTLFEASPEAIFCISRQGTITRANQQAIKLSGYDSDELIGMSVDQLVPSARREGHRKHRAFYMETGESRRLNASLGLELEKADGEAVPVAISLSQTVMNGETAIIAILHDETEERRIQDLTRLARDKAEEANRLKSAFLANMSHEIRTPLAGMLGLADVLKLGKLDPEQDGYVTSIRNTGGHLEQLLNDILDLSKIEANHLRLSSSHFMASSLFESAQSTFGIRAVAKGVDFSVTLDESLDDLVLEGDPLRVRQILFNLVGNALKFTFTGSIAVTASYDHADNGEPGQLRFAVMDTGVGIPEVKMQSIFDPFEQIQMQNQGSVKGTGLGLSISRRLAEMMNGHLTVESKVGEGSVFTCEIGIRSVVRESVITAERMLYSQPVQPQSVLVADDNALNRTIADKILTSMGHHVSLASDGLEAIDKLAAEDFDVVLLDINMPGKGGAEVLKAVDQGGLRNGLFVAFTADVMDDQIRLYREAGFDDYLAKPTDWQMFNEIVYRHNPPHPGA